MMAPIQVRVGVGVTVVVTEKITITVIVTVTDCVGQRNPVLTYQCYHIQFRVRVRVRVRVKPIFERRSGVRTRVDGVCDFETVPPEQLCPSAKRD